MIEEKIGQPSSRSATEPSPLLAFNETRAPIDILSPAKRAALVACFNGDGVLHKRNGVGSPSYVGTLETRISGVTVADLSRDGMLIITVIGRSTSARLTARGAWFARTAATESRTSRRVCGSRGQFQGA
jgi:deoxyinosine 3'endonuclease (endonuclease V)